MSSSPTADEKAVLAVCHKFLNGIRTLDPSAMHSCVLANGQATLIRSPNPNSAVYQVLQITLAACVDRVPFESIKDMEENIALATWEAGDDGDLYEGRRTEIRVDHDLAVAWTPYEFRVNGAVTHVGTNTFNFMKRFEGDRAGEWVITGIADTARKP